MPSIDVLDSTIHYEETGSGPVVSCTATRPRRTCGATCSPRTGGARARPDRHGPLRQARDRVPLRRPRALPRRLVRRARARRGGARRLRLGRRAGLRLGRAPPRARARHRVLRDHPQAAGVGRVPAPSRRSASRRSGRRASASGWCSRRTSSSRRRCTRRCSAELERRGRAVYPAPYPTPESRRPLLAWPRSIPIGGEPADVVARVEAYDAWLASSDRRPEAAADLRLLADADDRPGADGVV